MLYKEPIYLMYLDFMDRKKKSEKKSEFSNVMFTLCDYAGGDGNIDCFYRNELKKLALENESFGPKWLWGRNCYKYERNNKITFRITDEKILRDLIFTLARMVENDYNDSMDFGDIFYIEDVSMRI